MSNLNLSRRALVAAGLASGAAIALGLPGAASGTSHQQAHIATLEAYLDASVVTPSMRCSARVGDGVPAFEDVAAFMARIDAIDDTATLHDDLIARSQADHDAARIVIIDGWVLTRTEALAASAVILMRDADCALTTTTAQ